MDKKVPHPSPKFLTTSGFHLGPWVDVTGELRSPLWKDSKKFVRSVYPGVNSKYLGVDDEDSQDPNMDGEDSQDPGVDDESVDATIVSKKRNRDENIDAGSVKRKLFLDGKSNFRESEIQRIALKFDSYSLSLPSPPMNIKELFSSYESASLEDSEDVAASVDY